MNESSPIQSTPFQLTVEQLEAFEAELLKALKLRGLLRELWAEVISNLTREFNLIWRDDIENNLRKLRQLRPLRIEKEALVVAVPEPLWRWVGLWRLQMVGALAIAGHPEMTVQIVPAEKVEAA